MMKQFVLAQTLIPNIIYNIILHILDDANLNLT